MIERLKELHPRRFFLDTWNEIDSERNTDGSFDWDAALTMLLGIFFLILMEYWGNPSRMRSLLQASTIYPSLGWLDLIDDETWDTIRYSENWEFLFHGYWALWRFFGFFLLPVAWIKLRGQKIKDQGLSTKGFFKHLWIYLLCLCVVLLCVAIVVKDSHFQDYYPFYRKSSRSWLDFITWEFLYMLQFFGLEFFFRGWWLEQSRAKLGSYAIFAMTVPYVMIHFGKPMIETIGAIIAGVVLGTLAMKTRSIWSGFLIHVSVAVSMDLASMWERNAFPTTYFPF